MRVVGRSHTDIGLETEVGIHYADLQWVCRLDVGFVLRFEESGQTRTAQLAVKSMDDIRNALSEGELFLDCRLNNLNPVGSGA